VIRVTRQDDLTVPKITRTHIALIIGFAMVLITINAVIRVRYFGMKEREYWMGLDAGDGGEKNDGMTGRRNDEMTQ